MAALRLVRRTNGTILNFHEAHMGLYNLVFLISADSKKTFNAVIVSLRV